MAIHIFFFFFFDSAAEIFIVLLKNVLLMSVILIYRIDFEEQNLTVWKKSRVFGKYFNP